ncbi:unnamed protein product [Rotaria magnacalcarata]|uniref:Uncharacterized protein n=1 Tax=Rotaria magnacalcarata TaxID=392030 RepID=A0A816ZKZ8_9BILA|nr:unnamed protein product [Rotaria magnacalcarata]
MQYQQQKYPSCSKDSMDMQSSVISSLSSMTITTDDVNNKIQPNELLSSISNFNENNSAEDEDDLSDNYDFTDLMHYEQPDNLNLHAYTSINCLSFSHNVINFIRNANISKSHAQQLIDLIQSGLPQPNNLPIYYLDVLELLSGHKKCQYIQKSCTTTNRSHTIWSSSTK